ncbi:MAG: cis/trans isomerase [Hydrocarboniphaga sp.]|uniref:fatty acid cis/trans isomerase n=1 Tax=Hydrocarboniphaga sp. TaxID=2033016 RepID=UPI00262A480B|nr:fatty acid cis/trans isomerase [Hydrocarboniphaga sp.]MDB5969545.1 cis/trans isomerase [Hydrocarboniphaga sp.]
MRIPTSRRAVSLAVTSLLAAVLFACATLPPNVNVAPPVAVAQTDHYQADIQPIFDNKCAACHGCYDAPCQLKLTSDDGVLRGASKAQVYDGVRLDKLPPTRLGLDAQTVEGWRQKGFYSALYSPKPEKTSTADDKIPVLQASLLGNMIALGKSHSWPANGRIPDSIQTGFARANECPTIAEFDKFTSRHPNEGMPLAVGGLTDQEFDTINTWLAQGAVVEPSPLKADAAEIKAIGDWETYLNRAGPRERLVARYLYEHLFIAHIYFESESADGKAPHFFELLRSRTPGGETVEPIATVSPNDDPSPEGAPFYYRFRILTDTVLEKTHIIYSLSDARRQRYDELFFAAPWAAGALPAYGKAERANPFLTFAAIPAAARYQFMLDNAEYFVRSFIRGPVCAGADATNVINDQFWTMFVAPGSDSYVNDEAYRKRASPLLGLPGEDSKLLTLGPDWEAFKHDRNEYARLKQQHYAKVAPRGPALSDIWDGDGHNHDALLTIFRHYDNASVRRGLLGAVPQTIWVMDYPLLERSYYQLVVNFNVFGNVAHQIKTRMYFDLIRNGAEETFLQFLPPKSRKPLLDDWYQDLGRLALFTTYVDIDTKSPTRIVYKTQDPKNEFAQKILARLQRVAGPPDLLNRCAGGDCSLPKESALVHEANQSLRALAAKPASALPVARLLPEVTLLRVQGAGGQRLAYTLVHNRAHTNVAFILGEDRRLVPEQDTLTVLPGVLGSYPNFIFDVPAEELGAFVDAMQAVKQDEDLSAVVDHWGIRRTHPDFWAIFHDFTSYQREQDPLEAGILDMNRYENL